MCRRSNCQIWLIMNLCFPLFLLRLILKLMTKEAKIVEHDATSDMSLINKHRNDNDCKVIVPAFFFFLQNSLLRSFVCTLLLICQNNRLLILPTVVHIVRLQLVQERCFPWYQRSKVYLTHI